MMKIIIEDGLLKRIRGGIREYTDFILKCLPEYERDIQILYVEKDCFGKLPGNSIKRSAYLLWLNTFFLRRVNAEGAHLVHFTNSVASLSGNFPKIVTVQDLRPWTHPAYIPVVYRNYLKILVPFSVKVSRLVLTVSSVAKSEILKIFKIKESKVAVLPPGIRFPERHYTREEAIQTLQEENNFFTHKSKYVLFLGSLAVHKNLKTLLRAFVRLQRHVKDVKLIIAGEDLGEGKVIKRFTEEYPELRDKIYYRGPADYVKREMFFAVSDVLVMTSFSETFGMPAVEAGVRGLQVVVPELPVFNETLGKWAVFYGEPGDDLSLSAAIEKALSGRDTEHKEKMKKWFVERYNPALIAGMYVDTYRRVVDNG